MEIIIIGKFSLTISAILAAILDSEKSHKGGERPPGLNFIETLRTIEKSKETIVNGPNKVMGPAIGLQILIIGAIIRPNTNQIQIVVVIFI